MMYAMSGHRVVVAIGLVISLTSFAVEDSKHTDPVEHQKRPTVIPELKFEDAQLLGYYFSWPLRLVDERFKTGLPEALASSSKDKQGAALANILGELYVTQGPTQIKSMLNRAEALKGKREQDEKDTQVNSSSNHLLERLIDAGKYLLGMESGKNTPERKEFLTQFHESYEKFSAKNKEALAWRDKAIDPNQTPAGKKEAKEWLRTNVNRDHIMAFINAQMKSGNEEEAIKWFKAMSWEEGGQTIADFQNNGNPVRFYAGKTDKEIASSLKAYESQDNGNAGLFGIHFSPTPHTTVARELYQSKEKIIEGRPDGIQAPAWQASPAAQGNVVAATEPAAVAQALPQRVNNSVPKADAPLSPRDAFTKYCTGCHGPGKSNGPIGAHNKDKALARTQTSAMPPPHAPQPKDDKERKAIEAYIKSL